MSDFLIPPPNTRDEAAWLLWMEAEKKAAAVEKRKATMQQEAGDPEEYFAAPSGVVKGPRGVYRQAITVGFSGDFTEGTGSIEVAVDEGMTKAAVMSQWRECSPKRGTSGGASRKGRAARRRAARKRRK